MITYLHDGQIALGYPGQQIGKCRDLKVASADFSQYGIVSKQCHQLIRYKQTGCTEEYGNQTGEPESHIKQILNCTDIPTAPVLGAKNAYTTGYRGENHVLDELNLCSEGNSSHGILVKLSQHDSIPGSNHGKHQALKSNGERKMHQLAVECTVQGM